jgi:antitoxin FitA
MSDIEWRRLRNVTAREIVNALVRDGFVFHNQRDSHQRYRHSDGRRVTVTFHLASDTFPLGTLRSIMECQARWTEVDLRRLLRCALSYEPGYRENLADAMRRLVEPFGGFELPPFPREPLRDPPDFS